jgi:hypothetical protein
VQNTPIAQNAETASLDIPAFEAAALQSQPFDHVVVPNFVPATARAAILRDFPKMDQGGSFPAESLGVGAACAALLEALQGPDLREAMAAKFDVNLGGRPSMMTFRGHSRAKDGRIHRDSSSKILTALIYLNETWEAKTGRLRLLRGPDDMEDYVIEVPPDKGTLIAFRCAENAYHGYKPFIGERRSLQLNWVTDEAVKKRELSRHGFSAFVKSLSPFGDGRS